MTASVCLSGSSKNAIHRSWSSIFAIRWGRSVTVTLRFSSSMVWSFENRAGPLKCSNLIMCRARQARYRAACCASRTGRRDPREVEQRYDDRVAQRAVILGGAERHDVDARAPSRLRRAATEPRDRIGETHPSMWSVRSRRFATSAICTDLVDRIDPAKVGRLGQTDRDRLASVEPPGRDRRQPFDQLTWTTALLR